MEVWGRSERWRGGRVCQRSTSPMYVARGLWVGLQVSVKCMCCTTHLHGGFGPAVTTRSPIVQVFSTFIIKQCAVLTLQYAECPENVSMEMWGQAARAQSKIEQICDCYALGCRL